MLPATGPTSIASARGSIAGWPRAYPTALPGASDRTTCEFPTRSSPVFTHDEHRASHRPIPGLRGPAAGDLDRAPGLRHAVVAGHVRARALKALGRVPGRRAGREGSRIPGVRALRRRLAP